MQDPDELIAASQVISGQMESLLDGNYIGRVRNAYFASAISICSIRIRRSAPIVEQLHIVSRYVGTGKKIDLGPDVPQMPFFTITFEEVYAEQTFDISLGFIVKDQPYVSLQPTECTGCIDEEFCSQQEAERSQEDFDYLDTEIMNAMNFYSGEWSNYLAEFVGQFGFDTLWLNNLLVINLVYDTWDEIPRNLEPGYEMYDYNPNSDAMVKNSNYCRKEECDSSADSGIHCWSHEDLCAVPDCFDYKDEGNYCWSHESE